ncbi:MAG: polysaccharide deacetylase family protein [Solirubrobacterales bacterium]
MDARKMDKRRRPNPRLRIAVLVSTVVVLASMAYSMSTSLAHTDVRRPSIEVSELPRIAGAELANSNALYVSPAEQTAALKRLVNRNRPLFCAGKKDYAALTFDDGPSSNTPELLKLLKSAGIPATFFVTGKTATDFPQYMSALAEHGAIANHSWSHSAFTTLNGKEIKRELATTQAVITRETDQDYMAMRPPYGARNSVTTKTVDKLGYAEILWSADSEDGLAKDWRTIAKNTIDGLGPGSVVLMHDRPDETLTALRKRVIPAIRRSGLRMVTVPELLVLNPPSAKQLDEGPRGCTHAGEVNVSGYFGIPKGEG